MSRETGPERDWKLYIQDMVSFAKKVEDYTAGYSQSDFIADSRTYDATLRNLELIGEAATRIPNSVRRANPEIPWRLVIATRNRLIHAYLGIDNDTVWSIVQEDIPELLEKLTAIANP